MCLTQPVERKGIARTTKALVGQGANRCLTKPAPGVTPGPVRMERAEGRCRASITRPDLQHQHGTKALRALVPTIRHVWRGRFLSGEYGQGHRGVNETVRRSRPRPRDA